nr:hypothetical protein OG409_01050 [Streptomyces sp. NBC_00974]
MTGHLNLHQCAYVAPGNDVYTTVLPNTTSSNTGTNVSDTADTTLNCAPPTAGYTLHGGLSGVAPLG